MRQSTLTRPQLKDSRGQTYFDFCSSEGIDLSGVNLKVATTEFLFLLCLPPDQHLAENSLRFLAGKTGPIRFRTERLDDREAVRQALEEISEENGIICLVIEPEHARAELISELKLLKKRESLKERLNVIVVSKDPYWENDYPQLKRAISDLKKLADCRIEEQTWVERNKHFCSVVKYFRNLMLDLPEE